MSADDYTGYMPLAPVARAGTLDADYVGPAPRQQPYAPGEREQFEAVRAKLDRALQVTGVCPSMPQEGQSPTAYEASLLRSLAAHAQGGRYKAVDMSRSSDRQVIASCEAHGVVDEALAEPERQGRLAPVRTVDRSGRTITEFVGAKTWMNAHRQPLQVSPVFLDGVPQRV